MRGILPVIFLVFILLISSCCKAIFDYQTLLLNSTSKKLELRYYGNGTQTSNSIDAFSQSTALFNFPNPSLGIDSVLIFADGNLIQIHYGSNINKPASNSKIIQFNSPGNLLNSNYYTEKVEPLACDGRITTFIYQF